MKREPAPVPEDDRPARAALRRWLHAVGVDEAFSVLAELVPEAAVFAVDKDRNVVAWSEGAERLLGFTRAETLGHFCLKGIRCDRCMVGCGVRQYKRIDGFPQLLHHADGRPVPIRKYARSFRDASGEFSGAIELLVPDPGAAVAPELPNGVVTFHGLVSREPGMLRAFEIVRNVAETDATVLVRGESGTGKELVARAIHDESHRKDGPFVAINCAALAPTLLESELFGHKRGAFTGAVRDREGIFSRADGGTLFLDEVAELSPELQAKLLRVLQERSFVPVGGSEPQTVDVRIVAATHRSLRAEVQAGRFREDLMYRLRVVPIFLPALRERRGDVEVLLWHFVAKQNQTGPRQVRRFSPEAMRALLDHTWPGNVRELQNVVQYAFAVARGPEIGLDDLPPEFRDRPPAAVPAVASSPETASAPHDEGEAIREALQRTGGNVGEAAALLGMSRPTFWRHRKKLGI
jgi:two-component system response regulator AtoC